MGNKQSKPIGQRRPESVTFYSHWIIESHLLVRMYGYFCWDSAANNLGPTHAREWSAGPYFRQSICPFNSIQSIRSIQFWALSIPLLAHFWFSPRCTWLVSQSGRVRMSFTAEKQEQWSSAISRCVQVLYLPVFLFSNTYSNVQVTVSSHTSGLICIFVYLYYNLVLQYDWL